VQHVFGTSKNMDENLSFSTKNGTEASFGQIYVYIQMFRDLPMQVKLEEWVQEYRFSLSERFTEAIMEASVASDNLLMERKWVEQSPRYGEVNEIGQEVVEELSASYDTDRLQQLVELILTNDPHKKQIAQKRTTV